MSFVQHYNKAILSFHQHQRTGIFRVFVGTPLRIGGK